jgi:hypothetical protein
MRQEKINGILFTVYRSNKKERTGCVIDSWDDALSNYLSDFCETILEGGTWYEEAQEILGVLLHAKNMSPKGTDLTISEDAQEYLEHIINPWL